MSRNLVAILLASLLVVPSSYAAVLDEDNVAVSGTAGKFKDWSLTFFSIASLSNMKPNRSYIQPQDRSVESYNYFSINFKADSVQRYSLRLPFQFMTAGRNAYGDEMTSNFNMADIHFVYSNYDLGYIGDVDLEGKIKVYLPTGEASRSRKQIGQVRLEGYADYMIGRGVSVAYVVKPDIYWQSQTAAINTTIPQFDDGMFVTDPRSTTQQFGLEHYLQVQWEIDSVFALATKTGFDEGWYHASGAEQLEASHSTALRLGLDLWIRPMRGLSFTLGVSNQTYLNSFAGQNVAIGQPFNTQYSLMTNYTIF